MLVSALVAVAALIATDGFAQETKTPQTSSTTVCIPFHRVTVVDAETGRGIPAVELRTTDARLFVTDSAGVVAVFDPDLMGKSVFLSPESFGYSFPANGFGQRGQAVEMAPGGRSVLKMERINVAERLYRVTGSGIYRDSILLGDKVPATQDEALVPITGVDSVQSAIYKGKMYWFWGDTAVTRNPLGNFKTTGATSELPGKGGLDPDVGVSLTFFRNGPDVRPMFNDKHQPIWVGGPRVLRDEKGREHLFINYAKIGGGMRTEEHGLAEFDDQAGQFRIVMPYPADAPIAPEGAVVISQVLPGTDKGIDYYYYAAPWPFVRSLATISGIKDIPALETFTCFKEGARCAGKAGELDRDAEGNLRWGWKMNTSRMDDGNLQRMLKAGLMKPDEAPTAPCDVNTTATFVPQSGSVCYNEHRKRWISIRSLTWNPVSFLGEVAYFEADTPQGPWVYGQKIITHRMGAEGVNAVTWTKSNAKTYSFYNPTQHPEFDKEGGRIIYLEGTFTASFVGGEAVETPGYNYNQIMYKLDLDDPRVFMPVPVYRVEGDTAAYRTKSAIPKGRTKVSLAFFAPDRPRKGTVPVYEVADGNSARLSLAPPAGGDATTQTAVFYAVNPAAKEASDSPTVDLFEFTSAKGDRIYTTDGAFRKDGYSKAANPLCRVWPNPIRFDPLAWELAGR